MAKLTVIPSLDDLVNYEGAQLGVSDWVTIEQDRIDAFAGATGDRQWIHCDVERARRESPWKETIAHGYLTIALAPNLLDQLLRVEGWNAAINTGIDKMRLSSAVPAGSRVRMRARIKDVRSLSGGRVRVAFGLRFEVEGVAKPACTASVNYVYMP
jgi:acyl dehydratase